MIILVIFAIIIPNTCRPFAREGSRRGMHACCARAAHLACNQHAWFAAGRDQVSCDRLLVHRPSLKIESGDALSFQLNATIPST